MAAPSRTEPPSGAVFWVTAVIGAAIVAFGVRGLFENEPRGAASAVRWFIGSALTVDLIVVPLGAIAAALLRRIVPAWTWPTVRAALLASVVVIAFAAPLILEPQGPPANASVRPRDYATGLWIVLGAIWLVAGVSLGATRGRVSSDTP